MGDLWVYTPGHLLPAVSHPLNQVSKTGTCLGSLDNSSQWIEPEFPKVPAEASQLCIKVTCALHWAYLRLVYTTCQTEQTLGIVSPKALAAIQKWSSKVPILNVTA